MTRRLLDRGPNGKVVKTYLIFIGMAAKRETTTYGTIAAALGMSVAREVGRQCLDPISEFCKANGFPNLSALVVNAGTGEPGDAYLDRIGLYREREAVYAFDWTGYAPPTVGGLDLGQGET